MKKQGSSMEHHYLISPLHSKHEEELDRIRTEGDLTLIKVQTERKKLADLEAKLQEAHKQLRERKKAPSKQKDTGVDVSDTGKGKQLLAAFVLSSTGKRPAKQQQHLSTVPQEKEQESNALKRASNGAAVATGRLLQTEERMKVAVAERTVELQRLRHEIDETRRKRLEALASEKEMLKDIQEAEDDMTRAQHEIAQLKRQAAAVKSEIAATELEFDTEKHAFRLERQRLLLEVEEIVKAEKQGQQEQAVPVSHKYSVFHSNIVQRRKIVNRSSKWKKITLEQKIVSFEQKKRLLDRIVEETNVKTLSDFIQKYNDQERIKAEVFARIEAQTLANAGLNESIAQLSDDIARLSGAGENDACSDNTEKPSELQKLLDADNIHIKRWVKDADIFTEAVKCLRDPIHDIYKEFFPNERNDDVFDSTATRESGMMRRIGAIEERIMQFIMAKILEETEASAAPNSSDTLRRLRQYQGRREQRDSTTVTLSKLGGVEPPSTLKTESNAQRTKDGKPVPEDDEDDDHEDATKDVAVMHSDIFRQKFIAASGSDSSNTAAQASTTGSPRKNATIALNI